MSSTAPTSHTRYHRARGSEARAGELEVTVADPGAWQVPGPPSNRGRGIRAMEGVCDHVSIDAGPDGTTVRLCLTT